MRLVVIAALVIPLGLDLFMPVPEDNPLTPARIEMGRRLFDDRRLSRDGTIACSSCHDPARAFSIDQPRAVGVFGRVGRRNAPALINRGYGRKFFWDGRTATLEEQVLEPVQDPNEMDLTLDEAESRTGIGRRELSQALASYVRAILSGDSPFDRFINGNRAALSEQQQQGLQLFRGRGNCSACHVGPTFSDERLHNTGIAWAQAGTAAGPGRFLDDGRGAISGNSEELGAFKTPTLREIARTAPYMHDGSLATLEQVVDFYSDGGRPNPSIDPEIHPVRLATAEKESLVAFLRSLSGTITVGR